MTVRQRRSNGLVVKGAGEPEGEGEGEAEGEHLDPFEGEDDTTTDDDTSGNGCGGVKLLNNPRRFLGDWLLVGLSLMVLVAVRRIRI